MTTQLSDHRVAPEPIAPKRRKPWPWPVALAVALLAPIGMGLVLIGGGAWWHFGSASAAASLLRGDALHIEPQSFDMGSVALGEMRYPTFRVSNLTKRTITIYGTQGFCSLNGCVGGSPPEQFPLDIAPWSTRGVTFVVKAPEEPGHPLRLDTLLYTSVGELGVTFSGKVRADDTSASS